MGKAYYQLNKETGRFEKKFEPNFVRPEKKRGGYIARKKYKSKYNPEGK